MMKPRSVRYPFTVPTKGLGSKKIHISFTSDELVLTVSGFLEEISCSDVNELVFKTLLRHPDMDAKYLRHYVQYMADLQWSTQSYRFNAKPRNCR